ncbi:MAG: hypothetical protein IKJ11_06910 [Clostridia bacterium]|nr:hypothetical protein [Clostridia bacterium]
MSDWALYFGLAAALCAACSMTGAVLGHIWGIDPSRETPGTRRRSAGCRLLGERIASFAAVLPPCLWLGACAGQAIGSMPGAAVCALCALTCAMLSYCAMFASVRREGRGMAHVCGEEHSEAMMKTRCALGCAACVAAAGALLMSLLRDGYVDVSNGHLFALSCALLPMLSMQMASEHMASVIRNEKAMLPAASGGVVCAAMIAMLMLLQGAALHIDDRMALVLRASVILVWLVSWAALVRLGAAAAHKLLERPFSTKRQRFWPKLLLCAAAGIALALAGGAWLFVAGAVLCACCALLDAVVCTAWLRRIGRGLIFRN